MGFIFSNRLTLGEENKKILIVNVTKDEVMKLKRKNEGLRSTTALDIAMSKLGELIINKKELWVLENKEVKTLTLNW